MRGLVSKHKVDSFLSSWPLKLTIIYCYTDVTPPHTEEDQHPHKEQYSSLLEQKINQDLIALTVSWFRLSTWCLLGAECHN